MAQTTPRSTRAGSGGASATRRVVTLVRGRPASDGAGVRLTRGASGRCRAWASERRMLLRMRLREPVTGEPPGPLPWLSPLSLISLPYTTA